ncbi:glycoside hydrolase family 140 protein [Tautonia plasticadhaerens]|uniref:Endoglucanase n=1 Tax=Tautonia plasticadhaerens TaxID=2527974 RepID=A0A518HBV5_9BACT|nr:glycoside hydrolase family 140 protein [Tautonia plasticadhaerens]QDV38338.1 Putative endoglucanase [Tautonia plasticadhaerens]
MQPIAIVRSAALAVVLLSGAAGRSTAQAPDLGVGDEGRFLVTDDGSPFFWLGDTAWELFHRLDREQARRYLQDRADKGFTVIQAVALAELDGLDTPNPYGHRPLVDHDPARPDVGDGPEDDYWDHVDFVVGEANRLGLVVGFLPTWGDKWNKKWGVGPEVFDPTNAEAFGRWLGERYKDAKLVWILGGDRPIESDGHAEVIRAMARGLAEGDGGAHPMTFHPTGGQGSSQWFHDDDWLDFNMRQNGHVVEFAPRYAQTRADYDRSPVKPVVDGEPIYEDHPIDFKPDEQGHSTAADVRRPLYWDLFSGAFGHTYGHHSVWQMWDEGREPINRPLMPWHEAIDQPGAGQMQYGRWLIESRPSLSRIPDDSIIVPDAVTSAVPGAGRYRYVATRDAQGRYAMVYAPLGRAFRVRMDALSGDTARAWWYDPRTGAATEIGTFPSEGEREFLPPSPGEALDWILVLDDDSQGFPPPGSKAD